VSDQPIEENVPDANLAQVSANEEPITSHRKRNSFKKNLSRYWAVLALITYILGLGSGYLLRSKTSIEKIQARANMGAIMKQINPADGFTLPVRYVDFAPKLIAAGAIDFEQFMKLYEESGNPLNDQQIDLLTKGSDDQVVINKENQHFLLNLFWALGLANQNKILTEGPMMRNGKAQVGNFASTGGWTLGAKPVIELYASQPIITLTEAQQKRLEEVTIGVFRPCCDNPTHFPDCNHGMAMLGLLELMASQNASVDEMYKAAKEVNAFWFPQQALELAVFFKSAENKDFAKADARQFVGQQLSSGSGFQNVHLWLTQNGKLGQAAQGGGSCGVK
jgi:hypothetical protein